MSDAVSKLVPLVREVYFDDTFNDVNAVLRMDAKIESKDIKTQLLIDLRHKKDKWKSKPRFYGTMSQPRQFEDLLTASLAMTCFHRLRTKENPTKEEILACYDEIIKWIRPDIANLVQILIRDVRKKQHENNG